MAPSVTTLFTRYPSVRIYEIDAETKLLLNYQQHYLNVTKWNEAGKTEGPLQWELLYDFNDAYGYSRPSLEALEDMMSERVFTDKAFLKEYQKNFAAGYPSEQIPSADYLYCSQNSAYDQVLRVSSVCQRALT